MEQQYQVLLFYKYVNIDDPEQVKQDQSDLCKELGLKCRTIVAHEGINATLEGTVAATEEYIKRMQGNSLFKDIHFKRSQGNGRAFPKITVKVRPEIVSASLGADDVNPSVTCGKYITSEQLHEWLTKKNKEFYMVDMRNDYEHKVGYFEGSILAPLKNFRDLPKVLEELDHIKDKTVVTVCTGGIRCEKASGFLVKHGFSDVYQLYGGIHAYMEKYPNQHFKGKLYVFDGRVTMGFNVDSTEHQIVGQCEKCGEPADSYIDCGYLHCRNHRHFICCQECRDLEGKAFCSNNCRQLAQN